MKNFSQNMSETGIIVNDAKSVESALKIALKCYLKTVEGLKKLPSELEYPQTGYAYSFAKYE